MITSVAGSIDLIRHLCLRRGGFKLASGAMSDWYVDLKPAMLHPVSAVHITKLLLGQLPIYTEVVGGMATGAIPLVSMLVLGCPTLSNWKPHPLEGFFIRREAKGHGTKTTLEGTTNLAGKYVVIVEDVTTTGQSAMLAVIFAKKAGAKVSRVLSVVDRQEGAEAMFAREGIPFKSLFTLKQLTNPGA